MWCTPPKKIDEVCSLCGSGDLYPIEIIETDSLAYKCNTSDCPNSKTIFPEGIEVGDISDGICKSCSERERAKIKKATMQSSIIAASRMRL